MEPKIPLSEVERLVEIKVRQVLAEMLGVATQPEPSVLSLKNAVLRLGYQSERQLYKDIESGLLRVGIEIEDRRRPGAKKARYFIDIPAARKRLASAPEKRKGL
ncbi:hypothetical protein PN498_24000 [Oscillatoria sp. CS-180]|uniref:hypothetical protein n=1 Tax=Oscillatoria sp. CS-180 TaxID=3021720 RepID=UPI00232BD8F4|nr:hypothetical protein [Oscillatoria sp. CS-180]MDB9529078.1 hypothetical protein [Oscillatoria sp. CS-180]